MVLFTRTCVRFLRIVELSALSNADMVSLGTEELARFFVGMMETGPKMNLQFYNVLVTAL